MCKNNLTKELKNQNLNKTIWILTIFIAFCFSWNTSLFGQEKIVRSGSAKIKPALNAYSFHKMLLEKDQNGKPIFTLFDLIDWCAEQNIDAIDVTGYYFPGYPEIPSDQYINMLKRKAFLQGVEISGTGIKNNFASPDPKIRAADVELAKKWIEVAAKLGAPVIRLFAGKVPEGYENKWDEVAKWMVDCFKECATYGEKYGVMIGIQNHKDMLQSGDQCLKILKAIDSKWVGIIVDTGKFNTEDQYRDIEMVTPFAVNWQVKESVFDANRDLATDYKRIIQILNKYNYRGYLPVETLEIKEVPYEPFVLVQNIITELNDAIKLEEKDQ